MKTHKVYAVGIFLGALVGVSVYGINSGWTQQNKGQKKDVITSVPEIVSCAQGVRVTKSEILNPRKDDATVSVEVENTSEVGIVAITMTTKNAQEAFTVSLRTSFEEGKEQTVVIEPHKTGTLNMAVSNVIKGQPLEIGSVMYANGTEEGCQPALKRLHDIKNHEETQQREENPR